MPKNFNLKKGVLKINFSVKAELLIIFECSANILTSLLCQQKLIKTSFQSAESKL